MKFNIDKSLLDAVAHKLGRVLKGNNTTLPILNSVKIVASSQSVVFTASDGNDSILVNEKIQPEGRADLVVEREGAVCIPKAMFKVIAKLRNGSVTIELNEDGTQVKFVQKKTELEYSAFDANEYPTVEPTEQPIGRFLLSYNLFEELITKTGYAAGTSDSRPVLKAINMKLQLHEDNKLAFNVVATDSHRLASYTSATPIDDKLESPIVTFNAPATSLTDALKSFTNKTDVAIMVYRNTVLLVNDNIIVFTRLLEGNYPETARLIPAADSNTMYLNLNKEEFSDSLSLLKTMKASEKENRSADAAMTINSNAITIQSRVNGGAISKFKQELQLVNPVNQELEMAYSADYVLEALKSIDTELVSLEIHGAMRPFLVQSVYADGTETIGKLTQLVLPIRTY